MNIEEALDRLKRIIDITYTEKFKTFTFMYQDTDAIETLLTAYEKEKEKNMELTNSYNQAIKETNEENRRCMLLAVENQDLKEKNKELEKKLEEINDINFPIIT